MKPGQIITEEMLARLPVPLQRHLRYAGVVGSPWIETVYLEQTGRFRLGADRPWMPMKASQRYITRPPSFQWDARFKMGGLPIVRARDRYEQGRGHMFGKIAGLFTVFDARGPELDQGAMVRYLNEMMWFPTAYLGDNLTWQQVDDGRVDVTFADGGAEVTARLFIDGLGRLTDFKAQRYRENLGVYSLDMWSTPITAYGELGGFHLPVKGRGIWHLPEGDLDYVELEITRIECNKV